MSKSKVDVTIIERGLLTKTGISAAKPISAGASLTFDVDMADYHDLLFNVDIATCMVRMTAVCDSTTAFADPAIITDDSGKTWEAEMLSPPDNKQFHIVAPNDYIRVTITNIGSVAGTVGSNIIKKS